MCHNKLNYLQHQASLEEVAEQCFQDSPDTKARSASAFRASDETDSPAVYSAAWHVSCISRFAESDSHDTLNQPAPTCLLHLVALQTLGDFAQVETSWQCSCSSSCFSGDSAAPACPKERLCAIHMCIGTACHCTHPSEVHAEFVPC